jgi:hypothetical protein
MQVSTTQNEGRSRTNCYQARKNALINIKTVIISDSRFLLPMAVRFLSVAWRIDAV